MQKPRSLPFRLSPSNQHYKLFSSRSPRPSRSIPVPPTLTPPESSEDEANQPALSLSPRTKCFSHLSIDYSMHLDVDTDSDYDMIESQRSNSPPPWAQSSSIPISPFRPANIMLPPRTPHHSPTSVSSGGRIPTPIYGHFESIDNIMDTDTPFSSVTRSSARRNAVYDVRHPLTPTFEDEDMDSPTRPADGFCDKLDTASRQLENALPPQPARSPTQSDQSLQAEGGKIVLAIGYRADCDKCKRRLPGHYNHFLRV